MYGKSIELFLVNGTADSLITEKYAAHSVISHRNR